MSACIHDEENSEKNFRTWHAKKAKLKQVHISLSKQVVANEYSLPIVTPGNIVVHGVHGMVHDITLIYTVLDSGLPSTCATMVNTLKLSVLPLAIFQKSCVLELIARGQHDVYLFYIGHFRHNCIS